MLAGYCVRRAGEPAPHPALTGVGGAPVRLLEDAALGLWLSASVGESAETARLREHDAVVRAALESATPLPLRFGTHLRDEEGARVLLALRGDEFLDKLERVAGRVEMGIRVLREGATPSAEREEGGEIRSGTEFLERRRRALLGEEEQRRAAQALLDEIERHLAPLGAPSVRTVLAGAGEAGTLAHLVRRAEITRYVSHVDDARKALPGARLRLSGPWAPYSFV